MTRIRNAAAVLAMTVVMAGATPVVFVGLSNQGAPAIEKNLTRLLGEHLGSMEGVTMISNDETRRLTSRIDQFTYPVMTSGLAAALKRCAPDSSLVVWGMVRECSVRPERRYFFGAGVRTTLTVELVVFNLAEKAYAYVGDAHASVERGKGIVFWFGPIEDAVTISAVERAELIDLVQIEGVKSCGRILQTLFIHDRSKNRKKDPPEGIVKKEVIVEPSPAEEVPEENEPAGDGEGADPGGLEDEGEEENAP